MVLLLGLLGHCYREQRLLANVLLVEEERAVDRVYLYRGAELRRVSLLRQGRWQLHCGSTRRHRTAKQILLYYSLLVMTTDNHNLLVGAHNLTLHRLPIQLSVMIDLHGLLGIRSVHKHHLSMARLNHLKYSCPTL